MPLLLCPLWVLIAQNLLATFSDGFDPYSDYVTLLMHMEGANNGTVFRDERNHPVSRVNAPVTSNTQAKFGSTSAKFNGSNDSLSIPASSDFAFGTGEFTIEAWLYNVGTSTSYQGVLGNTASSDGQTSWELRTDTGNQHMQLCGWNGAYITGTIQIPYNTWFHVAVSYSKGTLRLFLNGKLDASVTTSLNFSNAGNPLTIGWNHDTYWNGYIDELRVTKGIGRYTADFVPPAMAFPDYFSSPDYDPYLSKVVALCHMDAANGTASSDALGRNTNWPNATSVSTAQAAFGQSSLSVNGSTNYVDYGSSPDFQLGTNDFTIEGWIFPTAYPTLNPFRSTIISLWNQSSSTGVSLYIDNTGRLWAGNPTASYLVSSPSGTVVPLNTWSHVAFVRTSGTTFTIYLNGVQVGQITTVPGTFSVTDGVMTVGGASTANYGFFGYIDEIRVTRDLARYTAAFTPVRAPFADKSVADSFRTSFDPYYNKVTSLFDFDGANGATTISDKAASRSLTLAGTAALSTTQAKFGTASLYLDGSSFASTSTNVYDYDLSGGDFTVEAWIYPTNVTAARLGVIAALWSNTTTSQQCWKLRLNGNFVEFLCNGSGGIASMTTNGTASLSVNTWNQITLCKVAGMFHLFVNGLKAASMAVPALYSTAPPFTIGGLLQTPTEYFAGYIDDLRITKGVARRSSTYWVGYNGYASPQTSNGYSVRFPSDTFAAQTKAYVGFDDLIPSDYCGHALTYNGATIETEKYQHGGAVSLASAGAYVQFTSATDFLPNGDFTIEAWVNADALAVYNGDSTNHSGSVWAMASGTTNYFVFGLVSDGTTMYPRFIDGTYTVKGPNLVPNAWNHITLVRKSGVMTVYTNGVAGTNVANATIYNNSAYRPTIGQNSDLVNTMRFVGKLDSVRYTAAARYTSNFDIKNVM